MKKTITRILVSGLILSAVTLYSCKKEDSTTDNNTTTGTTGTTSSTSTTSSTNSTTGNDTTDVSFTYTSNVTNTGDLGSDLTLTINCTGGTHNNLKRLIVTVTGGSSPLIDTPLSGTSFTKVITNTLSVLGARTYTMTLYGDRGQPIVKTLTINVVQPVTRGPLDRTAGVVSLHAQATDEGNPRFLQLTFPFAAFTLSDFAANKGNIDLVYYYGQNNKATISSPSDNVMQGIYGGLNWAGTHITKLHKTTLTSEDFDEIGNSMIDSAITLEAADVSAWSNSVINLASGNVILFQTASGKLGLINVKGVLGTTNTNSQVQMDILCQE